MDSRTLCSYGKALIILGLAAAVAMVLALTALPAQAKAATADNTGSALQANPGAISLTTQAKTKTMTLENAKGTVHVYPCFHFPDEDDSCGYDFRSSDITEDEPTGLKTSNRKACSLESGYGELSCYFNKPGKVTVSYTWKGKRHTVKFVVHKWTRPMTSFKVNGNNYYSKFKNRWNPSIGSKYLTGKVKIKVAKGWKLTRLTVRDGKNRDRKITNNKTILKRSQKIKWITAAFTNKASGQDVYIGLSGRGFVVPM